MQLSYTEVRVKRTAFGEGPGAKYGFSGENSRQKCVIFNNDTRNVFRNSDVAEANRMVP